MPNLSGTIKIAMIFGTRPEVIKIAPVIKELQKYPERFQLLLIATGQHHRMMHETLSAFGITPDYDLKIMKKKQSLFYISRAILHKLESIFANEKPDFVLVQGDTTTSFIAALAAFYFKIPIGHIEAGYRSYRKYDPYPEEMNRQLIDVVSDIFFATSEEARTHLLQEGKREDAIIVTGSTAVEAALLVLERQVSLTLPQLKAVTFEKLVILFTCHRRESWGEVMEQIFRGVKKAVDSCPEVELLFPVHLNEIVQESAVRILGNHPRIRLLPPLPYGDMMLVLKSCYFVVTDSGGLQEEACLFGKPVLLVRDVTEKVEALTAGVQRVVGTQELQIADAIIELVHNKTLYKDMTSKENPYKDTNASKKIRRAIAARFYPKHL